MGKLHSLFLPFIFVVSAIYTAQIFSPLRLNNDNSRLLMMAEEYLSNGTFTIDGGTTVLPIGYPVMVATLKFLGIATPSILIGINVVLILTGIYLFYRLFEREYEFAHNLNCLLVAATLLSILFIRYAALPQSESLYFFLSATVLYLVHVRSNSQIMGLFVLIGAVALTCAAIQVRSIGIALIPALIFGVTLVMLRSKQRHISLAHNKFIWLSIASVFAVGLIIIAQHLPYWGQLNLRHFTDLDASWVHWTHQFAKIAQVGLNIPDRLGNALILPLSIVGLILTVIMAIGFLSRLEKFNPIDFYFICYAGIVLFWPFYQTRFWFSVVPILIAYLLLGLKYIWHWKFIRYATYPAALIFLGFGIAGHGYSTWLTFSGESFVERYGQPRTKIVYRTAFQNTPNERLVGAEILMLRVLRIYEPMARSR